MRIVDKGYDDNSGFLTVDITPKKHDNLPFLYEYLEQAITCLRNFSKSSSPKI